MPHLSQSQLDIKTKQQIISTFDLVLGKMDKNEITYYLNSLLSETERLMLAKRLSIAVMLDEGVGQNAISQTLCVTPETVNRINLSLLTKPRGFHLAFNKIKNDKLMNEVKKRLLGLASYSIKAAGGRI